MKKRTLLNGLGLLTLGMSMTLCTPKPATQEEVKTTVEDTLKASTPEEALTKLMAGNERYVNETSIYPRADIDRVEETAPHQAPFAAVVGCSDSRVPVELVFDQGIGDIFVIRTAGNNVNSDMVMGSVDYAIEHLGVKVLLVLGHGSCGGVTGAISGEEEHGNIGKLLDIIRKDVSEFVGKPENLDEAIHKHADIQVERILAYPHIAEKVKKGELLVKDAYYDVKTGKVSVD